MQSDGKSLEWGTEWGLLLYAYVVNPLQLVMAEIGTSDLLFTFKGYIEKIFDKEILNKWEHNQELPFK